MTADTSRANLPRWVGPLLGRPGVALAFAWGVAEGSFFFLVPDLLITLAALFSARSSLRHLAAAVAGSLVAGLFLFGWAERDPEAAANAVGRVPFVSRAMFETVARDFGELGVWAMCKGPLSGIPYKVYAVEAAGRVALAPFLLVTWVLFAVAGRLIKPGHPGRAAVAMAGYALYWAGVYAYYWTAV